MFFPRPKLLRIQISSRNIKSIIIDDFLKDLHVGSSYFDQDSAVRLVDMYNSSLKYALDIHGPHQQRMVLSRSDTQWYTSDLKRMKRELRKLERKYKKLLITSELHAGRAGPQARGCGPSIIISPRALRAEFLLRP